MATDKKLGPGLQFGQWTLGNKELGRGGNGVVWEAVNRAGLQVAVKFLHAHHFQTPTKRLARFKDEVAFLAREGTRAGLLPLLDSNLPVNPSLEDRPWLVTALADSLTKASLAGAGKLQELVNRIRELAQTLAGLHAERKAHRDIKPENLFVLNGKPVFGDFGLVDFPDKADVTESGEILGPLFYVAPELMRDAADVDARPGDVYALAKSLWVLASGQQYPLQGEMRADSPPLRLSTYCPHARAHVLDLLLERSTRHNPQERPNAHEFARELNAWSESPQSTSVSIDLADLAKEYEGIFETENRRVRQQQELITAAQGALSQFEGALRQVEFHTIGVTRQPAETGEAYDLPPLVEYVEHSDSARVLWRGALHVNTSVGNMLRVRLQSFVQSEALDDDTIRVLAGHIVRVDDTTGDIIHLETPWSEQAIEPRGSASLEAEKQKLYSGLIENVKPALQQFAEQVKTLR